MRKKYFVNAGLFFTVLIGFFTVIFVFSSVDCLAAVTAVTEDLAEAPVTPRKVEVDTTGDGNVDRVEHYEKGMAVRIEIDSNNDGNFNEIVYFEDGRPVRSERDTNLDGQMDTWVTY